MLIDRAVESRNLKTCNGNGNHLVGITPVG